MTEVEPVAVLCLAHGSILDGNQHDSKKSYEQDRFRQSIPLSDLSSIHGEEVRLQARGNEAKLPRRGGSLFRAHDNELAWHTWPTRARIARPCGSAAYASRHTDAFFESFSFLLSRCQSLEAFSLAKLLLYIP